jgi:BirA family biotin operon repressor/biotin-[acetyl-CoA-carboxylase] ligase
LQPDKVQIDTLRRAWSASRLGSRVVPFGETDSTNSRALELARKGTPDGTLVLAETQTGGRGRMGRRWHSPPGVNLYFSLVLRPSRPARDAAWLGLASAAAVARSLSRCAGLPVSVKWPNDVRISRRKVAGLLLEQAVQGDTAAAVVLGIGVNVNLRREDIPAELAESATSLYIQTGRPHDRAGVLLGLVESLEEAYARYLRGADSDIRNQVVGIMDPFGEKVRVQSGDRSVEGVVAGLADDGALVLRLDDERTVSVHAGETTGIHAVGGADTP